MSDELMTESHPFAGLDLPQTIELRWTMRDILAKRWTLTPIDPGQLETLIGMGLVEMDGDEPVLTNTGLDALRG